MATALTFSVTRQCLRSIAQTRPKIYSMKYQWITYSVTSRQILSRNSYATAPSSLANAYILDEAITEPLVQLVNSDGRLESEPTTLRRLLREIDRSSYHVIQISEHSGANPSANGEKLPLVKIVSKEELYKRMLERQAQQKELRRAEQASKIVEISWQSSDSDLDHRCKKIHEFLGEGRKVEVVVRRRRTNRRGAEKPSPARTEEIIGRIKSMLSDVPGSIETKAMDVQKSGRPDETVTFYFEGPTAARGKSSANETEMTEKDVEKKQKAEAKFKRKQEEKMKRDAEEEELRRAELAKRRSDLSRPRHPRNSKRSDFNRSGY